MGSSLSRGADSTTAVAHAAGAVVRHVWTAQDASETNQPNGVTTATGDMIFRASTLANGWSKLAIGATYSSLVAAGTPSWQPGAYIICTSATRPISPIRGLRIFETDTGKTLVYYGATTLWQPDWNQPWGNLVYTTATSNQGSITTVVDLTSLSATWTAFTNRSYRITGYALMTSTVAADEAGLYITDSSNAVVQTGLATLSTASQRQTLHIAVPVSPTAGSVTYKLRALRNSGTGTLSTLASSTAPNFISVDDVGSTGSAPAS